MDTNWRSSWDLLSSRAWTALNRYGPIPHTVKGNLSFRNYPRVRLTTNPGGWDEGSGPTTWTVFELFTETNERVPIVRESVWQQTNDQTRAQAAIRTTRNIVDLSPTIIERYAPLPREKLSALLREGCEFRVPIAWPNRSESITSGGGNFFMSYEFFTRDQPPAQFQLKWSFAPPDSWRPVIEWANRLQGLIDECLAATEPNTGTPHVE